MKKNYILLIFFFFSTTVWGQRLVIGPGQNLNSGQEKTHEASESIYFQSGFKATAGCHLIARIVNTDNSLASNTEAEILHGSMMQVYPNPARAEVTVAGKYSGETLTVFDETGNRVLTYVLKGEDPKIDISGLRKSNYVFKARSIVRVIKE